MLRTFIDRLYNEKFILVIMISFIFSLVYKDGLDKELLNFCSNSGIESLSNLGFVHIVYITSIPQLFLLFLIIIKCFIYQDDAYDIVKQKIMQYWLGVAVFVGSLIISIAFSTDVKTSFCNFYVFYLWRMLPLAFFSSLLIKRKEYLNYCMLALIYFCALSSGYVFYQGLIEGNMRACGFYLNALYFASIAICVEAVCFYSILFKLYDKFNNILLHIALTIIWAAIIYNGSRGAWLAIVLSLLVIICFTPKQYIKKYMNLLAVLFLETVLIFSINTRFINRVGSIVDDGAKPTYARYLIWDSSVKMFLDYPLTGVGIGMYFDHYDKKYGVFKREDFICHAHNNFLHVAAESGIIGLCTFIAMFSIICWRHIQKLSNKFNPYSIITLASIACFLLHGLTEYNFGANTAVVMIMWLIVGLSTVLAELSEFYQN